MYYMGFQIQRARGSFHKENVICMANNWLKEQDQHFFYSEVWDGPSAFQLQETVEKWQDMMYIPD